MKNAACGLAGLSLLLVTEVAPATAPARSPVPLAWLQEAGPGGAPVWRPGREDRFQLRMTARLSLGPGGPPAQEVSLSAVWRLAVVEVEPDRVTLLARLESPRLEGGEEDAEIQRIQRDLALPHLLVLDGRGAAVEARVPPKATGFAQTAWKAIAGLAQLARPEPGAETWTETEADTAGLYEARYQRADARTVVKRKTLYHRIASGGELTAPGAVRIEVLESAARFDLSPSGAPVRVEAGERLRHSGAEGLPPAEASTRLTLELLGSAEAPERRDEAARLALGLVPLPVWAGPTGEAVERDLDRAKVGGLDLAHVLAGLDAAATEKERSRLYVALVSLMRIDPAALAAAEQSVREGGPRASLFLSALGQAGSLEAQEALAGILLSRPPGSPDRLDLLLSLSLLKKPTAGTLRTIESFLGDEELGRQALYGLGTAAWELREREPETARKLVETILDRLRAASSNEGRIAALRALGNAGHPAAVAALKPWLEAEDRGIRAEALKALRRVPGGDVDEILARAARAGGDEGVRQAALATLRERGLNAP